MESCDLCVVPFKVREVEEVYVRLRVSGLSAPKKDSSVSTDKDGCLGERARCCGSPKAALLHGFEHGLSIVWEGHDQLELGPAGLLDWKIWSNHTHFFITITFFFTPHSNHSPFVFKASEGEIHLGSNVSSRLRLLTEIKVMIAEKKTSL